MARVNTGKKFAVEFKNIQRSEICKLVKVLNGSGSTFYSDTEVALLTESEYTTAFNNTVSYMINFLGWYGTPNLKNCIIKDTVMCPLPAKVLLINGLMEVLFTKDWHSENVNFELTISPNSASALLISKPAWVSKVLFLNGSTTVYIDENISTNGRNGYIVLQHSQDSSITAKINIIQNGSYYSVEFDDFTCIKKTNGDNIGYEAAQTVKLKRNNDSMNIKTLPTSDKTTWEASLQNVFVQWNEIYDTSFNIVDYSNKGWKKNMIDCPLPLLKFITINGQQTVIFDTNTDGITFKGKIEVSPSDAYAIIKEKPNWTTAYISGQDLMVSVPKPQVGGGQRIGTIILEHSQDSGVHAYVNVVNGSSQ